MSQDKKPSLAEWATIITAIAALITALGVPRFIPKLLAKKYLSPDKENISSNSAKNPVEVQDSVLQPPTKTTPAILPKPKAAIPPEPQPVISENNLENLIIIIKDAETKQALADVKVSIEPDSNDNKGANAPPPIKSDTPESPSVNPKTSESPLF